jgi:hypothetical protein
MNTTSTYVYAIGFKSYNHFEANSDVDHVLKPEALGLKPEALAQSAANLYARKRLGHVWSKAVGVHFILNTKINKCRYVCQAETKSLHTHVPQR